MFLVNILSLKFINHNLNFFNFLMEQLFFVTQPVGIAPQSFIFINQSIHFQAKLKLLKWAMDGPNWPNFWPFSEIYTAVSFSLL